ncbi:hypothetical protein Q5O89_24100 [Peribacillus frigoritolerans]|nr:hypothetical protein [Peribacillus frigoritolerans]
MVKYQYQHLGKQAHALRGQAFLLASHLLKTPISNEMQSITSEKRTRKLAQMALFYIVEMGPVNFSQSKVELSKYEKYLSLLIKPNIRKSFFLTSYQLAIKSNLHKLFFILQLLYPSSLDEKTLRLPKHLRFLYFPLRPFLWAWRMIAKAT